MKKNAYKIEIDNERTFPLEYHLYVPENSSNTENEVFLYLHGLPGGPLDNLYYIPYFLGSKNLGFSTIVFNYPGIWSKNGFFSPIDILAGIKGIFNDLKKKFSTIKSINLYGDSIGGLVACYILGNSKNQVFENLKINKVILKSPVLDLNPLMNFLPATLGYLKQAGIINVRNIQEILKELTKINPPRFFSFINEQYSNNIFGVFGKNDEILPAKEMIKAVINYPNIKIELWENFPHNSVEDTLTEKFATKIKEFIMN